MATRWRHRHERAGLPGTVETALQVDMGEGLVVPGVTIPAFVLLKLMAWQDRHTKKNTDASDLLFVLRQYFHSGNDACVYEEGSDLLEACDYNVEIAAAGLLGRDARAVAHPQTRQAVCAILQTPETLAVLKSDLIARAATLAFGEYVDDSDDLLDAFAAQFVMDPPDDGASASRTQG